LFSQTSEQAPQREPVNLRKSLIGRSPHDREHIAALN